MLHQKYNPTLSATYANALDSVRFLFGMICIPYESICRDALETQQAALFSVFLRLLVFLVS